MNQSSEIVTRPGIPSAQAFDRESWLFRRVTPDTHPLRELLRHCLPESYLLQSTATTATDTSPHVAKKFDVTTAQDVCRTTLLDNGEIARRIHELPPLPRALTEALRVVRSDTLSADGCVHAIEQDATLAAHVLRLANSPFYGACSRVSSIGDGVRLLGLRTVAGLVVAVFMRSLVKQQHGNEHLLQSYWRHAVATATAARELAPYAGADPDEAFLAGLLHDLGRLVLTIFAPELAQQARAHAQASDIDERDAEVQLVGRSHDDVGAAVVRHWLLPDPIVAAIELHHAPSAVIDPGSMLLASVVHVANAIAHAMDLAGDPAEAVPPIDSAAWSLASPSKGAMPQITARVMTGIALMASTH